MVAVPTGVVPLSTVKVTVPPLTAPAALVTAAESATLWLFGLYAAVWLLAAVLLLAALTINVCVLLLLTLKLVAPL